jgi:hypothetical protein
MKEFEKKVAIVTGTTGIARSLPKSWLRGASVIACGMRHNWESRTSNGS